MTARKVSATLTAAGSAALDRLQAVWALSISATIDKALQVAAAPPAPAPAPPPAPAPAPAPAAASLTFTDAPITLTGSEITKVV